MLTSTRALSSHKWAGNFWFGNKRFLVFKLHSFNGFSRKRELNSAAKSFSNHTKQKAFCYPRPPFDSNRFVLFPNFASLQRRHVAGYRQCLYGFEFKYILRKQSTFHDYKRIKEKRPEVFLVFHSCAGARKRKFLVSNFSNPNSKFHSILLVLLFLEMMCT